MTGEQDGQSVGLSGSLIGEEASPPALDGPGVAVALQLARRVTIRTHRMARATERLPMTPEQLAKARRRYWANLEHCRAIARASYYRHLERNRKAARERMARLAKRRAGA